LKPDAIKRQRNGRKKKKGPGWQGQIQKKCVLFGKIRVQPNPTVLSSQAKKTGRRNRRKNKVTANGRDYAMLTPRQRGSWKLPQPQKKTANRHLKKKKPDAQRRQTNTKKPLSPRARGGDTTSAKGGKCKQSSRGAKTGQKTSRNKQTLQTATKSTKTFHPWTFIRKLDVNLKF